jgi:hypothetical protein
VKLMEHLRSLGGTSERFDQIIGLSSFDETESFNDLSETERLRRGCLLAEHWEAIADECDRFWATRAMFSSWSSAQMRTEAAIWREGRDPR